VPGVAREIFNEIDFWRRKFYFKKNLFDFLLAYVTPGELKSFLKKIRPFGPAVWPASYS